MKLTITNTSIVPVIVELGVNQPELLYAGDSRDVDITLTAPVIVRLPENVEEILAQVTAKQEADDLAAAEAEAKAKQEADDLAAAEAEAKAKQEADDLAAAEPASKSKK